MVITDDLIRRFPFAVAPRRITAQIEADIGRDMRIRAIAEGHAKRLPASPQNGNTEAMLFQAEVEAAVIRSIMAGDKTAWQFVQNTKYDRAHIDRAIAAMLRDGRLMKGNQLRANSGFVYSINPNYSADTGSDGRAA